MSIVFLSAEYPGVASFGLGSAAVGGARSVLIATLARTQSGLRNKGRQARKKNLSGVLSQLKPTQPISIGGSKLDLAVDAGIRKPA